MVTWTLSKSFIKYEHKNKVQNFQCRNLNVVHVRVKHVSGQHRYPTFLDGIEKLRREFSGLHVRILVI